jgi:hypothetical protein
LYATITENRKGSGIIHIIQLHHGITIFQKEKTQDLKKEGFR